MPRIWCGGLRSVAWVILVSLLRRWGHNSIRANICLHRRSLWAIRGLMLWLWLLARQRPVCGARPHEVGGIMMLSVRMWEYRWRICH